jgi:hypothetical protein
MLLDQGVVQELQLAAIIIYSISHLLLQFLTRLSACSTVLAQVACKAHPSHTWQAKSRCQPSCSSALTRARTRIAMASNRDQLLAEIMVSQVLLCAYF